MRKPVILFFSQNSAFFYESQLTCRKLRYILDITHTLIYYTHEDFVLILILDYFLKIIKKGRDIEDVLRRNKKDM